MNYLPEAQSILLFLIVVFAAAFLQGVTGFGFGILFMSFIPAILGFKTSVGICALLSLLQSLSVLIRMKRWPNIRKILVTTLSFSFFQAVGTDLLFHFNNSVLKIALGITLILFAGLFMLNENGMWKLKSNPVISIMVGGFSGIIGGLLGIGGPPIVFYYRSLFEDKTEYIVNTQATFVAAGFIMFLMHIYHGNVTPITLGYSGMALIVLVISTLFGLKVFHRVSKGMLTRIIILFLFITGIVKIIF